MKPIFILVALLGLAYGQNCDDGQFECDNGDCIPGSWICDGDNDCGDGSDERQDCPPCPPGTIECANGGCVYEEWACDGDNDCGDWSDEAEEACPCADDETRCPANPGGRPGDCIPPEYVCDPEGIWDCYDGSDEANCTVASVHKVHKVRATSVRNVYKAHKKSVKAKKIQKKAMDARKKFLRAIEKKIRKNKRQ